MAACAITASELITSLGVSAEQCHRAWLGSAGRALGPLEVAGDRPPPPQPWHEHPARSMSLAASVLSRLAIPLSEASRRWGPAKIGVVVGDSGHADGSEPAGGDLIDMVCRSARARGPAYAITGDMSAGASAVRAASDLLGAGHCDGVVVLAMSGDVGPRSRFWEARGELGGVSSSPLNPGRDGLRPGEGIAALLVERQGHADVELRGGAVCDDPADAIQSALADSGVSARQLTWALCGADGRVEADRRLAEAMRSELGRDVPVTSAVACRGSLGAAQDVAAIVDVARSVAAGRIGPMLPGELVDSPVSLRLITEPTSIETDVALTLHAGVDGTFTAFVVGAREP